MENLQNEIWKPVMGYEGMYEISNYGRVKSLGRAIVDKYGYIQRISTDKLLKLTQEKSGYLSVVFNNKGFSKKKLVHRVVAIHFLNNPQEKPQVNHKDGIKNNCHFLNLEWATISENTQHAYNSGLIKKRFNEDCNLTTISNNKIDEIKNLLLLGFRNCEISKMTGICKPTISSIKNNRARHHNS